MDHVIRKDEAEWIPLMPTTMSKAGLGFTAANRFKLPTACGLPATVPFSVSGVWCFPCAFPSERCCFSMKPVALSDRTRAPASLCAMRWVLNRHVYEWISGSMVLVYLLSCMHLSILLLVNVQARLLPWCCSDLLC